MTRHRCLIYPDNVAIYDPTAKSRWPIDNFPVRTKLNPQGHKVYGARMKPTVSYREEDLIRDVVECVAPAGLAKGKAKLVLVQPLGPEPIYGRLTASRNVTVA